MQTNAPRQRLSQGVCYVRIFSWQKDRNAPHIRAIWLQICFFLHVGITPARTGNIACRAVSAGRVWDHPRSCGEYLAIRNCLACPVGSPPLARGILRRSLSALSVERITPARAGNILEFKPFSGSPKCVFVQFAEANHSYRLSSRPLIICMIFFVFPAFSNRFFIFSQITLLIDLLTKPSNFPLSGEPAQHGYLIRTS